MLIDKPAGDQKLKTNHDNNINKKMRNHGKCILHRAKIDLTNQFNKYYV